MPNYKFFIFVLWLGLGIMNLCSDKISKLDYACAWSVVIAWSLLNWLESVI